MPSKICSQCNSINESEKKLCISCGTAFNTQRLIGNEEQDEPIQDTYKIILLGIRPNQDASQVKTKLCTLLRASPEQIDKLLAVQNYILKKGLSIDIATRYKTAIEAAGCLCQIEPESNQLKSSSADSRITGEQQTSTLESPSNPQASFRYGETFQNASDKITDKLGLKKIEGFSLANFFSDVFVKHGPDEVERLLSVGAPETTPLLHPSMGYMPNPWIFFRVLSGTIIVYLIFLFAWNAYENINLVPGLIIVGSFAVPFSILILFFELNTPKNISIIKVVQLVIIGGAISLLFSLILFEVTPFLGLFGASAAGFIEEVGKLVALLFAIRTVKIGHYKYRLNALLLGAAIGTGFAAFESAGYALRIGLTNTDAMLSNIQLRGAMSPFAHIAWTAIAASAFWISRPHHNSSIDTMLSAKFLKLFLVPVSLHFIWNLPFEGPFMIKFIILGLVAWIVIISLVQSGLEEISSLTANNANN